MTPELADPAQRPPWISVAAGAAARSDPPLRSRRLLIQVIIGVVLVILVVGVVGVFAARKLAEAEAVNDAAKTADLLADAVLQPALLDGATTGTPAAIAALDRVVREHMFGAGITRVKIWTPDGTIVYSDETRLIGRHFDLGEDEQEVFTDPRTRAEVSDLDEPENVYEAGTGPLLEVYRPVWTPSGSPLLFETYVRYDDVVARSGQLWRGFAGVTLSSILLLVALLAPVLWGLLGRVRRERTEREALLQKSLDASAEERRRIAGTLHDGVVQDLVGASYVIAGAAAKATAAGDTEVANELDQVSASVRSSIGGLRSLLVDIYPPSLESAGLRAALEDLVATVRSRGIAIEALVPEDSGLTADGDRLVFRIAQECLTNVVRHSGASAVRLVLSVQPAVATLEIIDNGSGFDVESTMQNPPAGHFGLRVMADTVNEAGAELLVSSTPGQGTGWQLRVPR